jgi:hypothetical protein
MTLFRLKLKVKHFWILLTSPKLFADLDKISMLHISALETIHRYSMHSKGDVVEVGAYIGGSTIALSKGTIFKVHTFEKGGSYKTHPHLPTDDILRDLNINLKKFKADNVLVIPHTTDSEVGMASLESQLGGRKIGLLLLDADGNIESLLSKLNKFLLDGALVVIDDYLIVDGLMKSDITNLQVNRLIKEGVLTEDCVVGWGTWFGKINLNKS